MTMRIDLTLVDRLVAANVLWLAFLLHAIA